MDWSLLVSGVSLLVSIAAISLSAVMMPKSRWRVQVGDASDFNGSGRMRVDVINESDSPMFGVSVWSNQPHKGAHKEPGNAYTPRLDAGKSLSVWVKVKAIRHERQFPMRTDFIRNHDLVVSLEWHQKPFLSWTRHRDYPDGQIPKAPDLD